MKCARTTWMCVAMSGLLLLPMAEGHAQFLPAPRFELELPTAASTPRLGPGVYPPASTPLRMAPVPSRLLVVTDSVRRRPSYARHALWGAGIGAAVGLAAGMYSYHENNSGCHDCWTPDEAIPVAGAIVGATVGFLLGSIVYLGARTATASEH